MPDPLAFDCTVSVSFVRARWIFCPSVSASIALAMAAV